MPGMASSLSSVPPVWPRPRPESMGTRTPQAATQRGDDEADLVADAAGAVLVDLFAGHGVQRDAVAGGEHDLGEVGQLPLAQAAEIDGHQPGRDLVIGDVAPGVAGDDEVDLFPVQLQAVPLFGDDLIHSACRLAY